MAVPEEDLEELTEEMLNPWQIQSIYDLQYFNCPSCAFKNHSKQEFINHAYEMHPKSFNYLYNVKDDSLKDIIFPNNVEKIKEESDLEKITDDPLKLDIKPVESIKKEHNLEESNNIVQKYDIKSVETIKVEPIFVESINDAAEIDTQEIATEINEPFVNKIYINTEDKDNDIDNAHEQIETVQDYKLECRICSLAFSEESLLKRHFDFMHPDQNMEEVEKKLIRVKAYKCNLCKKIFNLASNLKEHLQKCHGTMKKHVCQKCGAVFTQLHNLNYHMSSVHHENEIYSYLLTAPGSQQNLHNYKCDLCSLVFSEEALLKRHVNFVHNGPYCEKLNIRT